MTRFQRIKEFITGIIILFTAILMLRSPEAGYDTMIGIFAVVYTLRGISALLYYFTMARFMVGGRTSLYMGLVLLDFGLFTATLNDVPHFYLLLYLILLHAFSGALEVLSSLGSKRSGAAWKLKFTHGILNFLLSLLGVVFIHQMNTAVIIYAVGLIYSAFMHVLTAFRDSHKVRSADDSDTQSMPAV